MAWITSNFRKKPALTAKKIAFEYYAPEAEAVQIAGSFNNWDYFDTPLKKDRQGKWKTILLLPPGRYEYRYRVDGNWQNDPNPVECVPNPYGTWNCVLEIH